MAPTNFMFLNATGTPELSPFAAKRMRSHITRSNFAKRRQRILRDAETGEAETRLDDETARQQVNKPSRRSVGSAKALVADTLRSPPSADRYYYAEFLARLWSLVFLDGRTYPNTAEEAAWISFLVSEPALIESSMVVGARYWSPDLFCQQLAEVYSSRAANLIVQRIQSGRAHADAVIGAVLTMAFGERLAHNDLAWNVHIDGVAQLIRERRSHGFDRLQTWFINLLILDVTNSVLGFPRFYHPKIVKEASGYGFH
ncbi:hypothetical protein AB5N19_14508 [Seiridium cardinale]